MPSDDAPPAVLLVVDVANVMGSRPDGWWRNRAAAATRLLAEIASVVGGIIVTPDGVRLTVARVLAVVEGRARDVQGPASVELVRATADGDAAVAAVTADAVAGGELVLVVTADGGLRARLPPQALVAGPRWLLDAL